MLQPHIELNSGWVRLERVPELPTTVINSDDNKSKFVALKVVSVYQLDDSIWSNWNGTLRMESDLLGFIGFFGMNRGCGDESYINRYNIYMKSVWAPQRTISISVHVTVKYQSQRQLRYLMGSWRNSKSWVMSRKFSFYLAVLIGSNLKVLLSITQPVLK